MIQCLVSHKPLPFVSAIGGDCCPHHFCFYTALVHSIVFKTCLIWNKSVQHQVTHNVAHNVAPETRSLVLLSGDVNLQPWTF